MWLATDAQEQIVLIVLLAKLVPSIMKWSMLILLRWIAEAPAQRLNIILMHFSAKVIC